MHETLLLSSVINWTNLEFQPD